MQYSVMLITNDLNVYSVIREYISSQAERYVLSLYTANPVEAFTAAEDIKPHIIVIKEGLSFYNADQFIQDMVIKKPQIQYILLKDTNAKISLSPETTEVISATLYSHKISYETIGNALDEAIKNYHDFSLMESIPQEIESSYPEITLLQFHWIKQNELFAKVLNKTETTKQLLAEHSSLGANPFIMIIGEAIPEENKFFSYYQDIDLMGELYWRIKAILKKYSGGAAFITSERKLCMLINITADISYDPAMVQSFCNDINDMMMRIDLPALAFCRSSICTDYEQIPEIYREVDALSRYHFFIVDKQIISSSQLQKNTVKLQLDIFQQLLAQLVKSFDNRDEHLMIQTINDICNKTAKTLSFNTYRYVWSQLSLQFAVITQRYGSVIGKNNTFYDSENFTNIYSAFDAVLTLFSEMFHNIPHMQIYSDNPHIKRALKYVMNNISSDTSLSEVAKNIHLSSPYLSQLFQKEFERTYVDYTNELRVKYAANLLNNPIKVYEAAQQAGFEDSKYFSKVFKKYMGMPPQQYRKRQQEK